MTPKSLFIIILRVIGILLIKELIVQLAQLIATIVFWFQGYSAPESLLLLFISLLSVALVLWLSFNLIFKTEKLVTRFELDKGFAEERFSLDIMPIL